MIDWRNRTVIAGAAAVLISGFSIGFLTAKATEGGFSPSQQTVKVTETVSGLFGKPRDKDAPRAVDRKPAGFAVWKHRLDLSGASPAACIEFSKPLDASKSYGDYVLVSPELPSKPAVSVKDSELCISGFGFTDRRITLLKGLPSGGNDTLKANADIDFAFGEKPPYVGFAGNGVILPREDSDGVAVETLNVSSLAFEVWRVADRNLVRKTLSAPDPVAEGDYNYDGPWADDSPDGEGRKVWSGTVPVRGNAGDRVTTVFPLGAVLKDLKPGAYVIKVRDASGGRDKKIDDMSAQARRWILFTDLALTTYSGSQGIDVVVRSLKSAKPVNNVRVALVAQNGEELGEARTGSDGRVNFPKTLLKGEDALTPRMIMAYGPANDFTATDINSSPVDFSGRGVEGRSDLTEGRVSAGMVDGFLYTDRGIYRPGETVRLVALVRDNAGKAIKDRKGAIIVTRPSGVEAFRYPFDKTPQGFALANISLPSTAPRGQWRARLEIEGIDGDSGNLSFAVEDFAPQRLGVDVEANAKQALTADETRAVSVNARFLYGAVGSGLNVSGEARIRRDFNPFPQYKDYRFGNEQSPFSEKYIDLPETVTDGEGKATFPLRASEAGDTDQPLSVLLTAAVFEPGGRPVRESQTLRIRTKPVYFGVKVDTEDTTDYRAPKNLISIIGVNADGTKISVSGVKVRLIAENWNYDWYQQDGRWQWRRTSKDVVISDKDYDLNANTGINFDRNLDWGDYRLEVTHEQTGARTIIRFASGWGSSTDATEAPDFVRITAGKKTYAQGDTIDITLKSPYKGEAQIAVATDRLIDLKTVSVSDKGTTVRLKTDANWGGGAYIMVSVIQPRDPVEASKPRRAMGLIYVPLEPKSRKLNVKFDLKDKVLKPDYTNGQAFIEVPVKVEGTKFGERARVSVSIVDQGILNLTKFKSPDPVGFYFGKRALGVDYRDDYSRLLDPNLGAPAELNYGGDQIGGEGLTTTPIKTVALWSGVINTGLDGKAHVKLPVGKFNGELKIMAVAWTDEAVGSSDDRLTVRQPVVAELALPRFLSPGDKALATVELNNVEGKGGVYDFVLNGMKGIVLAFKKAFNIDQGQRVTELVEIEAPSTVGVSTLNLGLTGQGYSFNEDYNIQTRMGWGAETRVITEQQAVNQTWTPPASLLSGLQPGSATVQVSYSPFRGLDPAPLAAALNRYPYGCTEQIISAAYPHVYVSPSLGGDTTKAQNILKLAVNKVLDRQAADGAFGLWRAGDGQAEGWLGAYTVDFLLEAKKQGVYVPTDALEKALNGLRDVARPDGYSIFSYRNRVDEGPWWTAPAAKAATEELRSRGSAYALYVLAKGGSGDLARLRWYHDVQFKSEKSPLARAQVGAGLALMGDKARARSAFKQAVAAIGYKANNDWYQSPLRDIAAIIALGYEVGESEAVKPLIARLEREVKSPDSLNTQEQAQILRASAALLKASGPLNIKGEGVIAVDGKSSLQRFNVGKLSDAKLKNEGSGPVWRTVTVTGVPVAAPNSVANGLTLDKTYYGLSGVRIDPSQIVQGQKVMVVISGRSAYAGRRPIVIDDALPAGLEIELTLTPEDTRSGPFSFAGYLTRTDAQEARDDRYVAAFDATSSDSFRVAYVARAVTAGDYYLPGAEAKDMYRHDLFARTSGGRITIGLRQQQ
ncbi:MAG: alpha-2-macroglobulin [Asticcacaulis sp.]